LKRGHHHRVHPEGGLERRERDDQAGGGAVRNRGDEASPPPLLTLHLEQRQVLGVDRRQQQRHVVLVAKGARRRDHGYFARQLGLELPGDVGLDGAEHQVVVVASQRIAGDDGHLGDGLGYALAQEPAEHAVGGLERLAVGFAGVAG